MAYLPNLGSETWETYFFNCNVLISLEAVVKGMSNTFFFIIPVCSGMKGLAKDLKDQFIGMNIRQKGFLVHANDVDNAKRFNAKW